MPALVDLVFPRDPMRDDDDITLAVISSQMPTVVPGFTCRLKLIQLSEIHNALKLYNENPCRQGLLLLANTLRPCPEDYTLEFDYFHPFHRDDLHALYMYDFNMYPKFHLDEGFFIKFALHVHHLNYWAIDFAQFLAVIYTEVRTVTSKIPDLENVAFKSSPSDDMIVGFFRFRCFPRLRTYKTIIAQNSILMHPVIGPVHYDTMDAAFITQTEKQCWITLAEQAFETLAQF